MNKITAIGEILYDIYDDEEKLGGAPFNFIYHIIMLTGQGNFISRVGNDLQGNNIMYFLKSHNISTDYIQLDDDNPTGTAIPILNENKIPEWNICSDCAYDFIESKSNIKDLINKNTDCFYFGTLAQRGIKSRSTIQSLFNMEVIRFCDLNIRQNFYSREIIEESLRAADILKLNADEFKLVNGFGKDGEPYNKSGVLNFEEQEKAAFKLIQKFNIDLFCITLGEDGAVLYKNNNSSYYKTKTEPKKIVDTVGAGDAYSAILCIGYLKNWDIKKINEIASKFAYEIVKIKGALPEGESIYKNFRKMISDN
jgi:fructokinase